MSYIHCNFQSYRLPLWAAYCEPPVSPMAENVMGMKAANVPLVIISIFPTTILYLGKLDYSASHQSLSQWHSIKEKAFSVLANYGKPPIHDIHQGEIAS